MKRGITACIMAAMCALAGAGVAFAQEQAQENAALETLKARQDIVEDAQTALAEAPDDTARKARLNRAIRETFDFAKLAKESLVDHWDEMTDEQKEEYVRLFKDLVEKSTVRKLKAYRAAGTEYTEVSSDTTNAVITTVVTSTDGDEVAIQYKLHKVDGRWWIWDTTIGLDIEITEYDVSSRDNYRSAFNRIISDDGIEGLLDKLREKHEGGNEL